MMILTEPVLTVAAVNEIFKSKENIDVFEMPQSQITSEDEVIQEDRDNSTENFAPLADSMNQKFLTGKILSAEVSISDYSESLNRLKGPRPLISKITSEKKIPKLV